jgi:hypothetical protein
VNPLTALILLLFALGSSWVPWRRTAFRSPIGGLVLELITLTAAVAAALLAGRTAPGMPPVWWADVAFHAAGYWYALHGGVGVVRLVLGLVPVRAGAAAPGIAVSESELARGRIIGVLERAIVLTFVLLGEFGALGLVIAAKALARARQLDNMDFAEYFLIGTLASLAHALLVGVGMTLLRQPLLLGGP